MENLLSSQWFMILYKVWRYHARRVEEQENETVMAKFDNGYDALGRVSIRSKLHFVEIPPKRATKELWKPSTVYCFWNCIGNRPMWCVSPLRLTTTILFNKGEESELRYQTQII